MPGPREEEQRWGEARRIASYSFSSCALPHPRTPGGRVQAQLRLLSGQAGVPGQLGLWGEADCLCPRHSQGLGLQKSRKGPWLGGGGQVVSGLHLASSERCQAANRSRSQAQVYRGWRWQGGSGFLMITSLKTQLTGLAQQP